MIKLAMMLVNFQPFDEEPIEITPGFPSPFSWLGVTEEEIIFGYPENDFGVFKLVVNGER